MIYYAWHNVYAEKYRNRFFSTKSLFVKNQAHQNIPFIVMFELEPAFNQMDEKDVYRSAMKNNIFNRISISRCTNYSLKHFLNRCKS